jgi:TldD protein
VNRALLFLLLLCPTQAQAAPDKVFSALQDEMDRTVKRLRMGDLARPYFVAYRVVDWRRLSIQANFGGLIAPTQSHSRRFSVDLRVGGKSFDNTHYAGKDYWTYAPLGSGLVIDDDYDALRFGIWTATDRAYKRALEKLSQKQAYKQNKMIREQIDDLSTDPIIKDSAKITITPFDRKLWERRIKKLSAIFKRYPKIQQSTVVLYWTERYQYLVDSEGRQVLRPKHDFEIRINANTQAADGMRLGDTRVFIRRRLTDMPPYSLLEAETVRLAENVTALALAKKPDDEYIGPVLFEGQAAGEFFGQLLARNVSFPREIWVEDEYAKKMFHTGVLTSRLGLRAVSPFLSVEDDPSLTEFEGIPLIGGYDIDDEGIRPQRLKLIDKGILKELLMARSPTKKRTQSNGRGRSDAYHFPSARISNLVIWSEKAMDLARMKRELRERASGYGLPYAYIIRRLLPENAQEEGENLAAPILAYRIDAKTGAETLVRNVKFTGVTLRALRDIAAVSRKRHVHNFYQWGPHKANRGQTQASIIHPSILITEMELKKTDKKPDTLPYLTHPHFSR